MSFDEYGLSPELLSGLADVRIDEPTPLQNEVLPSVLEGKNMLVQLDTDDEGTFLIPALHKIAQNGEDSGTQVLILTPSIERAQKIDEMIWAMGYHAQISSALLDMKGKKDEQEKAVLDGAPVIVANPGRIIEILEKNNFHLRDLKFLVIDEAHNMENFNLVNRVKDILRFIDGDPQSLITSGRDNNATKQLVKMVLKDHEAVGFISDSSDQETEVDLKAAKEKLEEASVKVVLNPDQNGEVSDSSEEESAEESEGSPESAEVDLDEAEEKLKEASVKVVLNPDQNDEKEEESETKDESESETDKEETKEPVEVDLQKAEEKLKEAGVKVVLKKDLPDEPEASEDESESTDEGGEVEPVLANPVLQGEKDVLPDPVARNLEQGYINVPPRMKISTLMAHLEQSGSKKVIVFAASRRTTDRLFRIIRKKNWGVVSISDDIDENTYNERFAKFTSGEMRVLLVGGIAAKDVEIEEVQEVINYDVPSEVEEYKYRAELVGKGKAAQIISLVSKMDRGDIKKITDQVGFPPEELPLPEELEEKKKSKKSNKSSNKSDNRSNNKNNNNRRNNRGNDRSSNKKSGKNSRNKKRVKPKKLELPRPTYDGLSGGRDGNKKENDGIFGWVKKLFD